MRVRINPSAARGTVKAPPSKSMAHRLLICAALAEGVSTVRGISDCEDVAATLDCLSALGVRFERTGDDVTVFGKLPENMKPMAALSCRESGSTIRFFIPIALLTGYKTVFKGAEKLLSRPMDIYDSLCKSQGLTFIHTADSITVCGPLCGGEYTLPGNVSSQFISGLLFALPTAAADSRIRITQPIESMSYIKLTLEALAAFGIRAEWENEGTLYIPGGQKYTAANVTVEGDYSGAAFTEALNLFGGEVKLTDLSESSSQGDAVYREYYKMLNAGTPTVHIGDCPDLGPILFAIAAAKHGATFTGTKRLKIKESDRATAMAAELSKLGAEVAVYEDSVTVKGGGITAPNEPIVGHNDHRIVMSLAILLSTVGGEIEGAEAVKKSYPSFFDDLRRLGIEVSEYEA